MVGASHQPVVPPDFSLKLRRDRETIFDPGYWQTQVLIYAASRHSLVLSSPGAGLEMSISQSHLDPQWQLEGTTSQNNSHDHMRKSPKRYLWIPY